MQVKIDVRVRARGFQLRGVKQETERIARNLKLFQALSDRHSSSSRERLPRILIWCLPAF
jgi:hypothetical protein